MEKDIDAVISDDPSSASPKKLLRPFSKPKNISIFCLETACRLMECSWQTYFPPNSSYLDLHEDDYFARVMGLDLRVNMNLKDLHLTPTAFFQRMFILIYTVYFLPAIHFLIIHYADYGIILCCRYRDKHLGISCKRYFCETKRFEFSGYCSSSQYHDGPYYVAGYIAMYHYCI
jgi:hypothetical protein